MCVCVCACVSVYANEWPEDSLHHMLTRARNGVWGGTADYRGLVVRDGNFCGSGDIRSLLVDCLSLYFTYTLRVHV